MSRISAIALVVALAAANACNRNHEPQSAEASDSLAAQRAAARANTAAILDSLATAFHADSDWAKGLPRAQALAEPLSLAYQEAIPRLRQPVLMIGLIDDAWIDGSHLRLRLRSIKPSLPTTLFDLACPASERTHIANVTASNLRGLGLGAQYVVVTHLTDVRPTEALQFQGHISTGDDETSIEVTPRRIIYGRCLAIRRLPGTDLLDFVDLGLSRLTSA